jgi:hypothetical protein
VYDGRASKAYCAVYQLQIRCLVVAQALVLHPCMCPARAAVNHVLQLTKDAAWLFL